MTRVTQHVSRKGSALDPLNTWCRTKGTRALVRNRSNDLIEITIMEWSNSGEKVKLRFHESGHTRWVDAALGEYVLEEVLGKSPADKVGVIPKPSKITPSNPGRCHPYDLLWAIVSQALEDEKNGRVMRSFADNDLLKECLAFFAVKEDDRVAAMVEADDGQCGHERCRHMLRAAMAVMVKKGSTR